VSDYIIPTDAVWETARQLAECHEKIIEIRKAWLDCREEYTELQQQLKEARAALRETDDINSFITWDMWVDKHAAALKAAREET
jgi:hypothetical protein